MIKNNITINLITNKTDCGKRIDQYLSQNTDLSRQRITDLISDKAILLNNKYYIYNSKKVYTLNLTNGKLSESRLPNKINPKEIGLVLDEFQINTNNLPSAGGDDGAMYVGDVGGGDAGGSDSGGGE